MGVRVRLSLRLQIDIMYRLSKNERKYTTTPLVKVDEKGKETQILFSPLKKKEGEEMLRKIADFLNEQS